MQPLSPTVRVNCALKPGNLPQALFTRLPLFGGSVLIYSLGLLLSGWLANGNPARTFWLAVSVALFWVVCLVSRKPAYLYYLGLGMTTFLSLVGWISAANLDDDYLRFNFISQEILKINRLLSPHLDGLTMHRNTLAGMLAVFGVLGLSYGLFARRRGVRWLGLANSLVMLLWLLITNSRGGLFAFVSGGALLIGLAWPHSSPRQRRYWLGWGLGLTILAGGYLVASGQYTLFTLDRLLNENGNSRLEIWKTTLYMLGEVPLTGFGPGNFEAVYPFYIDPSSLSGRFSQEHAHNIFLQTYGEAGLPGFLAMLMVFGRLVSLCGVAVKKEDYFGNSNNPAQKELCRLAGWGGLAASGTMFVFGLTEYNPWNGQFTFLFWFPLALAAGAYRRENTGLHPVRDFTRPYKAAPLGGKLFLIIAGIFFMLLVTWQGWGLALVNRAGLESQSIWLGANNAQLDNINNLYRESKSSVGWTGVPYRGEAWVAVQKGDTARARQLLEQVIQGQPGDRRSLLMLGDLLAGAGQTAEALPLWRRAGAAALFVDRGRQLFGRDDDLASEPYFLHAIEIDPHLWDGYKFLVGLYQRHSRTPEAIALLEKARQFLPGDPRVLYELNLLKT